MENKKKMAPKNDIDLQAPAPTKRKRRSKAEITEARRKEDADNIEKNAGAMREEMTAGKTLRAKVAAAILSAIAENWEKIERNGYIATLCITVDQPPADRNTINVRVSFQQTIVVTKSLIVDDGVRELPLA